MGSVNKAILVGNLGRDAELRYTSGGAPVASVRIATTERFTDREGQKREDTQWHDVVIWGKTAEALHEYLVKGKQIYVEGRIQTRKWTDKEGKDRYTTEIIANEMKMLGSRSGAGTPNYDASEEGGTSRPQAAKAAAAGGKPAAKTPGSITDMDDDIPF